MTKVRQLLSSSSILLFVFPSHDVFIDAFVVVTKRLSCFFQDAVRFGVPERLGSIDVSRHNGCLFHPASIGVVCAHKSQRHEIGLRIQEPRGLQLGLPQSPLSPPPTISKMAIRKGGKRTTFVPMTVSQNFILCTTVAGRSDACVIWFIHSCGMPHFSKT